MFTVFAHSNDVELTLCESVDGEKAIHVMRRAIRSPDHQYVYAKEGEDILYLSELEERFFG